MPQQRMTQIQVRIDIKTKNAVRDILDGLGLDMSTAIKMFCKQIERTHSVPLELNSCPHSHVMSSKNKRILTNALRENKKEGKAYASVEAFMQDLRN